jgi:demethylmenaquinone methyltransferase/2-methoxy-6-polyprenyl-1,4-benzoquinol methylase
VQSQQQIDGGSGAMFDQIAHRYDRLNHLLSFGADRAWRRKAVAALDLKPGHAVLDVAAGTADMGLEILRRQPSARVVGVDPSFRMLALAQKKFESAGYGTRWELILGDAQSLPFRDAKFDRVCIAFGIRNVPDRFRALRQMARVLRANGRLVILELSEPQRGLLSPIAKLHIHRVVPRVGGWLSGSREYRYLQESIANFPTPEQFASLIRAAGFISVAVHPLTFGVCCLYVADLGTRS